MKVSNKKHKISLKTVFLIFLMQKLAVIQFRKNKLQQFLKSKAPWN